MSDAELPPIDAIGEVLSWLGGVYDASEDVEQRFYVNLLFDLLRPWLYADRVTDDGEPLWFQDQGEYTVMFRWVRQDGAYQIEGLVIQRTDGKPFLVSDLRKLRWRDLIADDVQRRSAYTNILKLRSETMAKFGRTAAKEQWAEEGHDPYLAERLEAMEAPARKRYPREHYVEVARLYDEALSFGSRSPNRDIAEELNVASTSTVKNWVVECRRLGLLPPTTERKAKGNNP